MNCRNIPNFDENHQTSDGWLVLKNIQKSHVWLVQIRTLGCRNPNEITSYHC